MNLDKKKDVEFFISKQAKEDMKKINHDIFYDDSWKGFKKREKIWKEGFPEEDV